MPNRSDTFDRTSPSTLGTPSDGGSAWEQLSGTGGVSANQATMLSGATATAVLESGLANVTVQYRAANPSGSSPAAVVRATDAGNYLRVYFLPGFRGHVYKREGGTETQLAAGNTGPVAAGGICTVECVGNRITSKVNGVVMATATTGFNAAATKHGLATQSNDTTSKFDDFSIVLLTSVTPDRARVLTGSSGTVTLSLVGTDTTWAGAPFSLSGSPPAGWTIAAQTVTSPTTATVTLARGTGTGALTLTDGTASATLAATDTATSVATGDWSAGATWDTREVPGAAHDAVVAAGHTVTVDAPAVVDDLTVSATGTLVVGAGQSLTADAITVGNAILQVGEDGGGAALVFGSLSIGGNGQTDARFRTRDGNFCRLTGLSGAGISGTIISGPVDGIYVLGDAGTDNPHLVRPRNTGAPTTFANGIIEYTSTVITDGGNWFYAANAADWTVDRCLTVFSPNIVGGSPGAVTFANLTCRVTNCTLVSGQYSGGILAGDGAAVAGTYPEVRDNIFWTNTGTACCGVSAVGSGTSVADVVTPSGCHHNGFLNAASTRYMGNYPTTQPGASDDLQLGDGSAYFHDPGRNVATWAVTRGSAAPTYAGRVADALVDLRDDPSLIAGLMAYVREGFAVTYAPWRTASSTGAVLGAVQEAPPVAGGAWSWFLDNSAMAGGFQVLGL